MNQEIAWDIIINKLNNHSFIDQNQEEDRSDPVFLPAYHQIKFENIAETTNETIIVQKNIFTVNSNFMITRSQNLSILKVQSLQNMDQSVIFNEHNYQISEAKFYNNENLCASSDISGLILVWKIYFENQTIKVQIIMKGKFEDNLGSNLFIEWKNIQTVCTYNQNEISLWTFNDENQCKGPLHFQTQVFDNQKIQCVKFSKFFPIVYVTTQNKIIIMNSVYFSKIKEFIPYKNDKISQLFIFKSTRQKNRDILITLGQKGILKVWDLLVWIEEKKRFQINQKINIQTQTLAYKKTQKENMTLFADFDQDQNLFFVLSQQQSVFILQIFQVDQNHHQESEVVLTSKKLFVKQTRFQIPGQNISNLQITQILHEFQDIYFQNNSQIQQFQIKEKQLMKNLVYVVYTISKNNTNVNFIEGENFEDKIENNLKDIQQIENETIKNENEENFQIDQQTELQNPQNQQLIEQQNQQQNDSINQQQLDQQNIPQNSQQIEIDQQKDQIEKVQDKNKVLNKEKCEKSKKKNKEKEKEKQRERSQSLFKQDDEQQNKQNSQNNKSKQPKIKTDEKVIQCKQNQSAKEYIDKKTKSDSNHQNEIIEQSKIQNQDNQGNKFIQKVNNEQVQKDSIEAYISQKLNQIFQDKNYSSQIENQIKEQIEISLKKDFQENFSSQITPLFEKYLEQIFKQVANNFDLGKDFYNEKVNLETQKLKYLEQQMNENMTYFNKQSKMFQQFTEQSIYNFNQIENKISERENTINNLVEQMQFLQKSTIEQNQKLIELEKNLSKIKKNEDDQDQTFTSQMNSNFLDRKVQQDQFFQQRNYNMKRQEDPINHLLYAIDNFKGYVQNQQNQGYQQNQSFMDKSSQEFKNPFQFDKN